MHERKGPSRALFLLAPRFAACIASAAALLAAIDACAFNEQLTFRLASGGGVLAVVSGTTPTSACPSGQWGKPITQAIAGDTITIISPPNNEPCTPGPQAPYEVVAYLGVLPLVEYQVSWSAGPAKVEATLRPADITPAQLVDCANGGDPGWKDLAYLDVSPTQPTSAQAVTLTVGRVAYDPKAISARVADGVIDVTLSGSYIGFIPPPTGCLAAKVGPLAPGTYTINAYVVGYSSVPGSLAASTTMTVVAATHPYVPPRAYVSAGVLYTVDVQSRRYVGDPVPISPGQATGYIAVSPGGRFVYDVTRTGLQGQPGDFEGSALAIVDVTSGQVVGSAALPKNASALVVAPDGGAVYVVNGVDPALGGTSVTVVAPHSRTVVATVPVPELTGGIAVTPDGLEVILTTESGLAALDTRTNAIARTLPLPGRPVGVAISPDGSTAYVPASFTGGLDAGAVLFVRLRDGSIQASVPVGSYPSTIAVSPAGSRLYVADMLLRSIQVINVALVQNVTAVALGAAPSGIAVTPSGDRLFVTKLGGPSIAVIDTATNKIVDTIVGPNSSASAAGTRFLGPMGGAIPYAIEYYHGGFGHYFLTGDSLEAEKLDATPALGWTRTGQRFGVHVAQPPGTTPVCRFFSTTFGAKSSHFYAPRGLGCESTFANPSWRYEGDVYSTRLPDSAGACPAATVPVYRMYNGGQGGAPNHRLFADPDIRAQMLAQGWIAEGAGVGVGMCAPSR